MTDTTDGRTKIRDENVASTLEEAIRCLTNGEPVKMDRVARSCHLAPRSVYRYWEYTENLVNAAGVELVKRLLPSSPTPNCHQEVLRSPAVAAAIMIAAAEHDEFDNPAAVLLRIDRAAFLAGDGVD